MRSDSSDTEGGAATEAIAGTPDLLPSRLELAVVGGPDAGRVLDLRRGVYVIGKSAGCDLVLADPAVSRRHLEVRVEDARATFRDLDSMNGSFFGGGRFREIAVTVGARVRTGSTELELRSPNPRLPAAAGDAEVFGEMVGRSAGIRAVFEQCRTAARSAAPVLILGESGTGKELCARAIHRAGARRDKPFVVCDLAGLSRTVLESELFGHVRGAFTGATADRPGAFAQAHGGTIFVDELGELEADLQPRLLRVIDSGEVKAVGSSRYRTVDVRIIAATQRALDREVSAGRFRLDLFYRLAVLRIQIPPLRERREDLAPLVEHLVSRFRPGRVVEVPAETLALLESYEWRGNVRELRNTIERVLAMAPDARRLDAALLGLDLPGVPPLPPIAADLPFHEAKERLLNAWEREYVAGLLRHADGNVAAAARQGGLHRAHLYRLLKKHGLID